MAQDLMGLGKIIESVCGSVNNISNNIRECKIAKLNHEKELKLALQNILPQILSLPKDEREFFITSLYPKLIQYSNFHAFSNDIKDITLLSYSQIHPNIDAKDLKITDDNFKQLYTLIDLHLKERKEEVKKLVERCIKYIESGNMISLRTIEFIKNLVDQDLEFLRKHVIPFIDINNKCLIWHDDVKYRNMYDDLEVFPNILVNNYKEAGKITLQGSEFNFTTEQIKKITAKIINKHVYEIALINEPIALNVLEVSKLLQLDLSVISSA